MPALNIIGNILYPRKYGIGGVAFDAVISEQHTSEIQITQNPVETGLPVTDNIAAKPYTVVLDAVVTAGSSAFGLVDFGVQGVVADLGNEISASLGFDKSFGQKVTEAWRTLTKIQREGHLLLVQTQLKTYGNMVIIAISTQQDKDSPDHIRFKIALQEIVQVEQQTYEGTLGDLKQKPESKNKTAKTNGDTADRGASPKDSGKNAGTKVATKERSFLFKAFNPGSSTSATASALEVLNA